LLDIPVTRGRGITAEDRPGTERVAIVNETLARAFFGADDPLGRVLQLPLGNGPMIDHRIVGVFADTRNSGLRSGADPELLVAFDQMPWVGMTFLAVSDLPAGAMQEAMRAALWRVDPREAVTRQYLLADDIAAQLRPVRFLALVVGAFAAMALALAAFGVYSVASYRQRRRVPEFGVRLALGSPPARILGLVLGESLPAATLGVAVGLAGAAAALRLLATQLFGFEGMAAWPAYAAGIGAMLFAVLIATLAPAWRAARTDPMAALRYE
jgi:putative ABC transport system permease protein